MNNILNILAEFTQDKCDLLNNYNVGEDVKVSIRGREWVSPQGENILTAYKDGESKSWLLKSSPSSSYASCSNGSHYKLEEERMICLLIKASILNKSLEIFKAFFFVMCLAYLNIIILI
jgi:hypothetical protein